MKQIQCACGDYFFTEFDDECQCGKCRAAGVAEANPRQAPIITPTGDDQTDAFNASLNAAIALLRTGGGERAPNFYTVILQNEDTGNCVVMATTPNEERAGHLAAVIEQAAAGKDLGFRVRVEAVAIAAVMPRRIELVQ